MFSFTCKCTPSCVSSTAAIHNANGTLTHSFPGLASVASFIVHGASTEPPVTAFSSFFQIGLAFALGIMFAIIIAGPTSGGHFNPAVTIALAVWYVPTFC